jgi:glyceraldehyde 3-phosphate dehydrogenase
MKNRMNRFDCIGHLVTRATSSSDKVDIIAINDPFINLSYKVYMFQYDIYGKFNGPIKAENGKLVINVKAINISRSEGLPTSNE